MARVDDREGFAKVTFTVTVSAPDRRLLEVAADELGAALDVLLDQPDWSRWYGEDAPTDEALDAVTVTADLELED